MIESKSVQKRSVGRPKTNKALQKLRVQTWFNAVAEASGKTAYELEKEFAPSTVDREDFNKQRARLWEKYRLGKTMPTIKDKKGGKKGTAQLVEEKYPGTLKVLQDPIWTLADPAFSITIDHLKTIYAELNHEIKSLLVEDDGLTRQYFWRNQTYCNEELLERVIHLQPQDSLKVALCLLRESILFQNLHSYSEILEGIKCGLFRTHDGYVNSKIGKIISHEFSKLIV